MVLAWEKALAEEGAQDVWAALPVPEEGPQQAPAAGGESRPTPPVVVVVRGEVAAKGPQSRSRPPPSRPLYPT